MDSGELSDLEEGEILEYDSYSPVDSSDDIEIKNPHFSQFKKQNVNNNFEIKENERNWCLAEQDRNEKVSRVYKGKNNSNGKLIDLKPIDLESISSDGEYKSDDEGRYPSEPRIPVFNEGRRSKRKDSMHLYGTVEYIMSAIGETIFRKSRCNYKKRKSKEFFKYSDKSYDLWRDKIFSSHLKGKKRKRKVSDSDTDTEFLKVHVEERKKRTRKRKVYYEEEETTSKKGKVRDFDEMRKCLLEKRRKEEAEERLKALTNPNAPVEVENCEIQEVDMLIECTNYVDDPSAGGENDSVREVAAEEKEGEEEMDLMQLRLIALASNKKRKSGGNSEAAENLVDDEKGAEKCLEKKADVELDRNELLLRAEALKTALLNKHQKRLNKWRLNKKKSVVSLNDNDMTESLLFATEENVTRKDEEGVNVESDCKKDERKDESVETKGVSDAQESLTKEKESTSVPDANPKKLNPKMRGKRKKKKSFSLANSSKENSEKAETIEEDDNTLRSQLLSDLMRKKCLKDSERKPVLMDSMQTSTNQMLPPAPAGGESPKEKKKPLQTIKKNCLKNVSKVPVPQIQRIIIHLGSEDSTDEENGGNEKEQITNSSLKESEKKGKVGESGRVESLKKAEKKNEIIKANYEKSVEKLLSEARKKIEGKIQSKKNNATATPEAVYKHLPPSERLEYIRLKQKIAERERQRIQSSVQENRSNPANPLPNHSSAVSAKNVTQQQSTAVSVANSANGTTSKVKTNVASVSVKGTKKHLMGSSSGSSGNANSIGSNSLLLPSSQALISKLNLLLKKIKIEKTIEENYEKEISKLKNQLSLFERKKTEQRFKIKKLGEESMKTYKAIQRITARSTGKAPTAVEEKAEEKEKKKEEGREEKTESDEKVEKVEKVENEEEKNLGENKKEEETEKAEEKGKNVANEPETEISKESKIEKEPNSEGESVCNGTTALCVGFSEYSSPLEVFRRASEGAERLDPNATMCQFDLMGVCKDEECSYQHLRTS